MKSKCLPLCQSSPCAVIIGFLTNVSPIESIIRRTQSDFLCVLSLSMHCCILLTVSKWPDQYGCIGLLQWSAIAALYSLASEAATSHMQASISILSTKHILHISSLVSLAWIQYSSLCPLPWQLESWLRVVHQICLPTNGITLYSEWPEADCSYLSLIDNTCMLLSPQHVLTLTQGL